MVRPLHVDWYVLPARTPKLIRRCRTCDRAVGFYSTDKFRINANKRRIDVWLIYRCTACETTWKRPVLERSAVRQVGPELLERFHQNDVETAQRYAFDKRGFNIDDAVPFRVDRPALAMPAVVRIRLPVQFRVRWDRLLAQTLGLSRSRIKRLVGEEGVVLLRSRRSLNTSVRDGDLVKLDHVI